MVAYQGLSLVKEGVYPAMSVTRTEGQPGKHATMNLGASPFLFAPPEGYSGLEGTGYVLPCPPPPCLPTLHRNPLRLARITTQQHIHGFCFVCGEVLLPWPCMQLVAGWAHSALLRLVFSCRVDQSGWLSRYQAAALVTELVASRQPLPADVVTQVFGKENTRAECRPVTLRPLSTDLPSFAAGNHHGVSTSNTIAGLCGAEDLGLAAAHSHSAPFQVPFTVPVHVVFQVPDTACEVSAGRRLLWSLSVVFCFVFFLRLGECFFG